VNNNEDMNGCKVNVGCASIFAIVILAVAGVWFVLWVTGGILSCMF
jgi:hypothetical protein